MQVTIKNIQSIENVSFQIKGLTVLTGDNDIGKSATYRSIQALFRNTSGDSLIRIGTPEASVSITTESDTITWSKQRKKSSNYSHNGIKEDMQLHGHPAFIDSLGYGTIVVQKQKLDPHFSGHDTLPFLLYNTEQTLTDFFSEILQFGSLGKSLIACNKDIRESNLNLKVARKELERSKETLDNFTDLPLLEHGELELIALEKKYNDLETKRSLIDSYLTLETLLTNPPDLKTLDDDFKKIYQNYRKATLTKAYLTLDGLQEPPPVDTVNPLLELEYLRVSWIVSLLEPLLELNVDTKPIDLYLDVLAYLELDSVAVPKEPSFDLETLKYLTLEVELDLIEKKLEKLNEAIESEKETYQKTLKELGVCPVCEKEI